jgi:anti-sigma regulatory factor (Ser/Thr protein kinase)
VAYVQDGIRSQDEHVDETELMQVGIALQEALVNAMHHGNLEIGSELREGDGETYRNLIEQRLTEPPFRNRRVHVTTRLSAEELACVIRDEGPGFDPTVVRDPTDPENLERVSGRGLYLIWTFMDRVRHNESGNEITLVKQLTGSGAAA